MLFPTIFIVSIVVILPLFSIFWISVKPVSLADLRAPEVVLREDLRGNPEAGGDAATIRYRLRNSPPAQSILSVGFTDIVPDGVTITELDTR